LTILAFLEIGILFSLLLKKFLLEKVSVHKLMLQWSRLREVLNWRIIKMKDIVIIGAGGFGREVAWLIEDINKLKEQWNIIGFVDDNSDIQGKEINGYRVVGDINWLVNQKLYVVSAIGDPLIKKKIMERLKSSENSYPVLIHPSVICSNRVSIAEGSIICAGTTITVDIEIGKHVIINLDCTIGHDAILGDYTTVLPSVNVSGFVKTEECVNIGTGSAIIQGVTIGENTIVGAGSIVVKDLPSNCTAVGAPAKPIKFNLIQ
jgi:sugar O-acyltransferase (sialic acid O-acetyltransferase NeuD family)